VIITAGVRSNSYLARMAGLKVLGVELFSIGQIHPEDASYRVFEENGGRYACYVFRDTRLVGAIRAWISDRTSVRPGNDDSGE